MRYKSLVWVVALIFVAGCAGGVVELALPDKFNPDIPGNASVMIVTSDMPSIDLFDSFANYLEERQFVIDYLSGETLTLRTEMKRVERQVQAFRFNVNGEEGSAPGTLMIRVDKLQMHADEREAMPARNHKLSGAPFQLAAWIVNGWVNELSTTHPSTTLAYSQEGHPSLATSK